jgi:5-methylcytosine-specific restriction endonuclease McrA
VAAEIRPAEVVPVRTVVTSGRASSTVELELIGVSPGNAQAQVERPVAPAPRTVVEPLTRQETRMHVTVSPAFMTLLKKARAGQGHVQPGATDEQVLTAALELLIAQQEKRKASVPAKVKREVRARDQGKCQWPVAGGGVCGSTVRLEVDHVVPRGKGGPSTLENCRILCKPHNLEAARQVYGDAHMDLFTVRVPNAREPVAAYAARRSATRHLRSSPDGYERRNGSLLARSEPLEPAHLVAKRGPPVDTHPPSAVPIRPRGTSECRSDPGDAGRVHQHGHPQGRTAPRVCAA